MGDLAVPADPAASEKPAVLIIGGLGMIASVLELGQASRYDRATF